MIENPILTRWRQILSKKRVFPAIFSPQGQVLRTFEGLERESEHLREVSLDFPPASVVAIQIPNRHEWPALYLAGLKRGLILLPLESTLAQPSTQSLLSLCGAVACISQENGKLKANPQTNISPVNWGGESPDFLKATSGTTAAPRLVLFKHDQILTDCDQICETMGIGDTDINYGVIAFSHSYGFSNLVTPLICRGVPLVAASDMMPNAIFEGMKHSKATVFPGIPPLFNLLLNSTESLPQSLRLLISAGAPLSPEVTAAFHMRHQRKIHSFYGSSECGGICYDSSESPVLPAGFVGNPMQGVTLEKWNSDNADETQYRIHGKSVGMRYFPEDDTETLGNRTFLPADLLSETAAGYRITGRLSDIINAGGRKVNPFEVEAVIGKLSGVTGCVVFGVGDKTKTESIHACVISENISEQELRSHCSASLASWQIPRHIHFVSEISRNARGKISRRDLSVQYAPK